MMVLFVSNVLQTKILRWFLAARHLLPPLPFSKEDPDYDDEERDHDELHCADDVELDHEIVGNCQEDHCRNEEDYSDSDKQNPPEPARLQVQQDLDNSEDLCKEGNSEEVEGERLCQSGQNVDIVSHTKETEAVNLRGCERITHTVDMIKRRSVETVVGSVNGVAASNGPNIDDRSVYEKGDSQRQGKAQDDREVPR